MFVNGMAPRGGGDPPLPNGRRIRECRNLRQIELIIVVVLVFIAGIASLGIALGVNCLRLVTSSSRFSDLTSVNHSSSSNITVRYYSGEPNDDSLVCIFVTEYILGYATACFLTVLYFAYRVFRNYQRERQARPNQAITQGNLLEVIELNLLDNLSNQEVVQGNALDNTPNQVQRQRRPRRVRRLCRGSLRQLLQVFQILIPLVIGLILVFMDFLCLNSFVSSGSSNVRNVWEDNAYCGVTSVLEIVCSVAFFAIAVRMLWEDGLFEPIEVVPIENHYEPVMVEGNDREDSPPPLED